MTLPTGVPNTDTKAPAVQSVSLVTLTSMVVGTMVGAGVFSLPSNFAAEAGVVGSLIAWAIAGCGMLMIALVFQRLALRRPDLNAGMYSYAKAGFGNYPGFMAAFGYWASSVIGNVTYWVLIMSTLSVAFPGLGAGDTALAVVCSIAGVWAFHFLISRGVREAAIVNRIVTIAKIVPIIVFVVVALVVADMSHFEANLWGAPGVSMFSQVKNTMMITLFVFIGVEGATIFSRYARKRSDVGKATVSGFVGVLSLFALVSLVGFGSLTQSEIAEIQQPSAAGVFAEIVGPWGGIFMSVGLLVAVLGAYLAWTLMAAEVLYTAALNNDMPKYMRKVNSHGTPINALLMSSITASLFVLVAKFSEDAFNFSLVMTGVMALVPYALSGGYALRLALADRRGTAVSSGLAPFTAQEAELYGPGSSQDSEGPVTTDLDIQANDSGSQDTDPETPQVSKTSAHNSAEAATRMGVSNHAEASAFGHNEGANSLSAGAHNADSYRAETGGSASVATKNRGVSDVIVATLAVLYSLALIFAAGYQAILFACVLYVPGTILFVMTRKERGEKVFKNRELVIFIVLAASAVLAVTLLITGKMTV